MCTVDASSCPSCFTLEISTLFPLALAYLAVTCSLSEFCFRKVFPVFDTVGGGGGVAGSLDSQVTCHQLVSVTVAASPCRGGHIKGTRLKQPQPQPQPQAPTKHNQAQPTTNQPQPTTTNHNHNHNKTKKQNKTKQNKTKQTTNNKHSVANFGSSRGHSRPGLSQWASITSPSGSDSFFWWNGHPPRVGVGLPVPTSDDAAASLGIRLRKQQRSPKVGRDHPLLCRDDAAPADGR